MTSVLIADDQQLVRDGLRLILEATQDLEVVAEARDGTEAVDQTLTLKPDVVLMDVRMPVLDGLRATGQIVQAGSTAKVLMLTTYDRDSFLYDAIRAGASGFLLKDSPRERLVGAIRTVAAGDAVLHPELTRRLLEQYGSGPPPTGTSPRLSRLTERELDVLRLVARGATNSEIATTLHLSEATVKTHLAHLMTKLDLKRPRFDAAAV